MLLSLCNNIHIKVLGTQKNIWLFCLACHTCHKLWTEICEIRQIFKWDLIKFCESVIIITLELPQNSQKPLFKCKKLVINTTKCDSCLFLHKMWCKMVWKFYDIWKILWELASRWAKLCEILSHSVKYGMYGMHIVNEYSNTTSLTSKHNYQC